MEEERECERELGEEGGGTNGLGIYALFEEDLRGLDVLRGFSSTETENVIVEGRLFGLGGNGGGMSSSVDCLIPFLDLMRLEEDLNVLFGWLDLLVLICLDGPGLVLMPSRVLALNRFGKGGGSMGDLL